jgi:hypothetical protein
MLSGAAEEGERNNNKTILCLCLCFTRIIEKTMNKTIYTTYHSVLHPIVLNRWRELNPDYTIDFSLDIDCIKFIDTHFNRTVSRLFLTITRGMYKADLWRLCKLFIHGGVYADIDLVPFRSLSQITDSVCGEPAPAATFYSCLSMGSPSIFQAFMVHTRTRSPLLLGFLVSFLYNKPYLNIDNGPTTDMYHFILYNVRAAAARAAGAAGAAAGVGGQQYCDSDDDDDDDDLPGSLQPYIHYTLRQIRIPVHVSSIHENIIPLHYFPEYFVGYTISISPNTRNKWVLANRDKYKMKIENHRLVIDTKPDAAAAAAATAPEDGLENDEGMIIDICIDLPEDEPEVVYLFQEEIRDPPKISTCYMKDANGVNIMDCRDPKYIRDHGWIK